MLRSAQRGSDCFMLQIQSAAGGHTQHKSATRALLCLCEALMWHSHHVAWRVMMGKNPMVMTPRAQDT